MDLQTFRFTFPEFREVADEIITAQQARASRLVSAVEWNTLGDDGIAYLTAACLAASPFGMNTRLKTNDPTKTSYWRMYEELRQMAVIGGVVAGGACRGGGGWGWGGSGGWGCGPWGWP